MLLRLAAVMILMTATSQYIYPNVKSWRTRTLQRQCNKMQHSMKQHCHASLVLLLLIMLNADITQTTV
jgi:hypothetical protein